MNNTEKQQQVDSYISTLNGIVAKMEVNETNMANSQPMTDEPYTLRQDLILLRQNASIFISKQLPGLTKEQDDSRELFTWDKFKIDGVEISQEDGFHLSLLRWQLQDAIKPTLERFNQHLINLRPNWYPNIPKPIVI